MAACGVAPMPQGPQASMRRWKDVRSASCTRPVCPGVDAWILCRRSAACTIDMASVQRRHVAAQSTTAVVTSAAAAAALAARPDAADTPSKPSLAGAPQPAMPCDKPLPLANVMEVQRLLHLMEAPEYCMRAFRENGVNGQDILSLEEADMHDIRFKFPKNVQRKVLRIAQAWRTFQSIAGSPTKGFITMAEYVAYYSYGRTAQAHRQLESAYRMVDNNNNGSLAFEE